MPEARTHLIWSERHALWHRRSDDGGAHGYTNDILKAGIFETSKALAYHDLTPPIIDRAVPLNEARDQLMTRVAEIEALAAEARQRLIDFDALAPIARPPEDEANDATNFERLFKAEQGAMVALLKERGFEVADGELPLVRLITELDRMLDAPAPFTTALVSALEPFAAVAANYARWQSLGSSTQPEDVLANYGGYKITMQHCLDAGAAITGTIGGACVSRAGMDVLSERHRQVVGEGRSAEGDDAYQNYELIKAAIAYATHAGSDEASRHILRPASWPWASEHWKPADRRRDLVKAAALLIAQIEQIDRALSRQLSAGA